MSPQVAAFVKTYWGVIGAAATMAFTIYHNVPLFRNLISALFSPVLTAWRLTELEKRVGVQTERGQFWEGAHTDLLERYNDLERRFEQGLKDLRDLREEEIYRAETMKKLSADREAAYIWAISLRDQLVRLGGKPEMDEPAWTSTYNVLFPTRRYSSD